MHRFSTTSGAPLVYCTTPSEVRWRVVIILRAESKGSSPTRGYCRSSAAFSNPRSAASCTSATSVGSPSMRSPARWASEHSAIAVMSCSGGTPVRAVTVILF